VDFAPTSRLRTELITFPHTVTLLQRISGLK
jgi:hypothetical protein